MFRVWRGEAYKNTENPAWGDRKRFIDIIGNVLIRLTRLPETHAYLHGEKRVAAPFPTDIDGCDAVFAASSVRKWGASRLVGVSTG